MTAEKIQTQTGQPECETSLAALVADPHWRHHHSDLHHSALILYGYARHETINTFYQAHIKIRRVSDLLLPVVLSGSAISLISGALLALFLHKKLPDRFTASNKNLTRLRLEIFELKSNCGPKTPWLISPVKSTTPSQPWIIV